MGITFFEDDELITCRQSAIRGVILPESYTHMTLPSILRVYMLHVVVSAQ